MRRLLVSLAERSYDILIGPGLLAEAGRRLREAGVGGAVVVIADAHVAATYGAAVAEALGVPLLTLPAGEANKTLQQLERLYGELAGLGLDRQATLVAVGGGVTGDLVGFAAATFLRGINFVQVPTTLLAQVDASLGGKTAVDLPAGKNLVGAFHQPRLVLADLETLGTLPEDEYRSGLAEVVKYGVIADLDFLAWLEARRTELLARDLSTLEEMVARSCEIKAAVVGADERDRGRRAILNYGHTVGHAVEAAAGYGTYRHGEAVAIGMAAAGAISVAVTAGPRSRRHGSWRCCAACNCRRSSARRWTAPPSWPPLGATRKPSAARCAWFWFSAWARWTSER